MKNRIPRKLKKSNKKLDFWKSFAITHLTNFMFSNRFDYKPCELVSIRPLSQEETRLPL